MKLETFFEKFDVFADAPGAVGKLRELVTHLAVSGKLVPNNSQEKPVSLSLPSAEMNDLGLPKNWRCGSVGDVLAFEYGDNLPAPKRTETGEVPVYGSNGIVGTHDTYLTKEPAIIVGRKGSAGALNIATGPSWTTDVAYFVCPPKEIDLRFGYYLLSALHLDELGKGLKQGLSRKEAYALPIAIPPLAEQHRIVAKVDELMAVCDQLEAQLQERQTQHAALARAALTRFAEAPTPANLELLFHDSFAILPTDLRKSILTLAVQGKLVDQIPADGRGQDLLDCIAKVKEQLVSDRLIKRHITEAISEDDIPFLIPDSWSWTRLGEIGDWGSGSTPARGNHDFYGGGITWLKSGELDDNQCLRGSEETVTEMALKICSFRQNKLGDVLLAMYGATIGNP
jgi:type I restriction enzyme S subunit